MFSRILKFSEKKLGNHASELLKKIFGNGLIQVTGKIAVILSTVVISTNLGPSVLGEISFMLSTISIVSTAMLFGLDRFLVKNISVEYFSKKKRKNYSNAYKALKTVTIIGASVFLLFIAFLGNYLYEIKGYSIFKIGFGVVAILFIIDPLIKITSSILNAHNYVNVSQIIKNNGVNILACFFLLLLYILFKDYFDDKTVVLSYLMSFFLVFIIGILVSAKFVRFNKIINTKLDFKIFKLSAPFFLISLSPVLKNNLDRVFVGLVQDTNTLAVYDVSMKLANITGFLLFISMSALSPKISQLTTQKTKESTILLFKLLRKMSYIMLIPALLIFIVFVLFGKNILEVWGTTYREGYKILIMVSVAQLFAVFSGPVGVLLQMSGHERKASKSVFVSSLVQILIIFLIPVFGLLAAAFAYFMAIVIENVMNLYFAKKHLDYKLLKFNS